MTKPIQNHIDYKTAYVRVFVRKPAHLASIGKCPFTTISVPKAEYDKMLKFAYGEKKTANKAIRDVSETVDKKDLLTGDYSLFVRRKALARLRGMYMPAKAAAKLAAENNAAWEAVVNG